MGYLDLQLLPKGLTGGSDVAGGQIALRHLNPPLFLELQLVKLHSHQGADSRQLPAGATPEMVRGYTPREREEHGVAEWTGSASATGSLTLTFAQPFLSAPDVFVTAQDGNANIIVGTNTPVATEVTIYWRDATGSNHTTLDIAWLAKGR